MEQAVEVLPMTGHSGMSLAEVQEYTKVEADNMPCGDEILDVNLQMNPVADGKTEIGC